MVDAGARDSLTSTPLKLPAKAPVRMLVIDHVELPSAN
jgi:hypothetical protein